MVLVNLSKASIKNSQLWNEAGIEVPAFDVDKMIKETKDHPSWVHFGAGNIFRGFVAALQQTLLNEGKADTGIIAVETYDFEIIDKVYAPYDNLSLLVIMNPDGSLKKKVIGSISEGLIGDVSRKKDWDRLKDIFTLTSLQMVSFTVTEKGYSLKNLSGEYYQDVKKDMSEGPFQPIHLMSKIASLAFTRYKSGQLPIAFVSMDNCSHNGEKLHDAVEEIAKNWAKNGLVDSGFLDYINNPAKVSFPWTMIDKITPRPSVAVKTSLNTAGFSSTDIICTSKNTYIAPFVNAEGPEYLVIEDSFPNGRMPLENSGVIFTNRETVNNVEKMKVCTCLNPLHTALAIYGCLLGHTLIADEMKDEVLKTLAYKVGYEEGLPVVVDPGIISPEAFIHEVLEQRFPNPYIPDTPQRIATDTSLKLGIRFGETIKAYKEREDLDTASLTYIPLVLAGWCRYLLGLDDNGNEMPLSQDPMLGELRSYFSGVKLGDVNSAEDCLKPILSNKNIFGLELYEASLGEKVESYFREMISGKNAVRLTLERYLK